MQKTGYVLLRLTKIILCNGEILLFYQLLQSEDSPVPGGLVINDTGDKIYVTLSRNNSLGVIDLSDNSIIEIPVGIAPYSVLCASQTKAYVSNWGGRRPVEGESTYNSSGSQVLVDPKTGIANNGAVSVVDLTRNVQIKTIKVGLHPCDMVLSPDRGILYVACANSDIISVINTATDEVVDSISVHKKEDMLFGSSPNDLTISPDGKYLYVANGTENAVCVIQTGTPAKVLGYIPTGWYPGSVILNKTGEILYVANIKGIGSRNQMTNRNGYNSHDHLGTVSIIPIPGKHELQKMTETVNLNNSWAEKLKGSYPSGRTRGRKFLFLCYLTRLHFSNMLSILSKKTAPMIRYLVIWSRETEIPV